MCHDRFLKNSPALENVISNKLLYLILFATFCNSVSVFLTMERAGNMDTTVTLAVTRPFTVTPPFISSLVPGEEASCQVTCYHPTS